MDNRVLLRWVSAAADLVAVVGASVAAAWIRSNVAALAGVPPQGSVIDGFIVVVAASVVGAFYASGLYEREAYVSRALHMWALARASFLAFVVCMAAVFLIKADGIGQSRLLMGLTFLLFLPLAWVLRVGLLDRLLSAAIRRRRPSSLVIGDSPEAVALADRLAQLRGFDLVQRVVPRELHASMGQAGDARNPDWARARTWPAAVFIDTRSVPPRQVFVISGAALAQGAEVYALSGLLGPLDGSRLLNALFQAPVVHVRRSLDDVSPYRLKRVFDIVGSAALLITCSPIIAVLACAIRLTSPGPVFYTQTRVGRFGVPFQFLKLRSMVVNEDVSTHSRYVRDFIKGRARHVTAGDGTQVLKQVDDPRITRVGRFIRKYSLDEIPQFWNVLRGDMSLVGPRPPLPYEVSEYDEWHRVRLIVPPGVTGVWQAEGRSRVSFDEMILQDLMYAENMCLLVDVRLCLRTVPAALSGVGGG